MYAFNAAQLVSYIKFRSWKSTILMLQIASVILTIATTYKCVLGMFGRRFEVVGSVMAVPGQEACGPTLLMSTKGHTLVYRMFGLNVLLESQGRSLPPSCEWPRWVGRMNRDGLNGCEYRAEGLVGWPVPFLNYACRALYESGSIRFDVNPGIASGKGVELLFRIDGHDYTQPEASFPREIFPTSVRFYRLAASYAVHCILILLLWLIVSCCRYFLQWMRAAARYRAGKCINCGYQTAGFEKCPECGRAVIAAIVRK